MKSNIFTLLALILSALFITIQTSAQEINTGPATQLANFVIANADSTIQEADTKASDLWLPEKGISLRVTKLGDEIITIEIYLADFSSWCVNFKCQIAGNIYDGKYACKFLPTNAAKKVTQFDRMIADLNKITVTDLQKQRATNLSLWSQIKKWCEKARSYEEFTTIDGPSWESTTGVLLNWQGDVTTNPSTPGPIDIIFMGIDGCNPSNSALRKVTQKILTLGGK